MKMSKVRVVATLTALIAAATAFSAQAEFCDWCGCRGGPGYRAIKTNACVGNNINKVCGVPVDPARCIYEGDKNGPVKTTPGAAAVPSAVAPAKPKPTPSSVARP
jgi:hypothetical protein